MPTEYNVSAIAPVKTKTAVAAPQNQTVQHNANQIVSEVDSVSTNANDKCHRSVEKVC